jgi:hypothetical protein
MLEEYKNVHQPKGEPKRRWYFDEYFDLIVWYNESGAILGFQLSYDKARDHKAITWKNPSLYFHMRVDDGENRPSHYKSSPILIPDGAFDYKNIAERFKEESAQIDSTISELVLEKILNYS